MLPQLFEQEAWSILAHTSSWNLSYTRSRKARTALFVLPKQTKVIRFHEPYLIRKSQLNPGRSHKTDTTQVFCGLVILEQSTVFGRLDTNCSMGLLNVFTCRRDMIQQSCLQKHKANQNSTRNAFVFECTTFDHHLTQLRLYQRSIRCLSSTSVYVQYNLAFYESIGDYEALGCEGNWLSCFEFRNSDRVLFIWTIFL